MKFIATLLLLLCSSIAFGGDYPMHMLTKSETSAHFIYHYNETDTKYAKQLVQFSEGFLTFIERNYFEPSFTYPITALVFSNKREFHSYLKNKLGIRNPPEFGIYLKRHQLFATFRGSGIGTFAHEIMHPLVDANLPDRPVWAIEGLPSFFEKFFGYWDGDDLHLQLGYQNPWRVHRLGETISELDLRSIVMQKHNNYVNFSNSELRMVSVFIERQGLLTQYMKLVMKKNKKDYRSYIEAVFGKELHEIEPLWESYLEEVKANRGIIYKIPSSTIFSSKKEFEDVSSNLYLQKSL